MADVRSLLRQQRAARKITHPNAAYSEAGKLLCTLCHEQLKSDALWEGHIRSAGHRQRATQGQTNKSAVNADAAAAAAAKENSKPDSTDRPSDAALLAQIIGGKRKHDDDSDEYMSGVGPNEQEQEDTIRHKRSKQDIGSPTKISAMSVNTGIANGTIDTPKRDADKEKDAGKKTPPTGISPPGMVRRISGTPSHGVEIQIPSRPATPGNGSGSNSSTPKVTPMGRSPLIPQEAQAGAIPTSNPGPKAAFIATAGPASATAAGGGGDDADWAAFEAEVVHAAPAATATSTTTAATTRPGYAPDAVISAAPLTADQIAAKSEEEERAKRRAAADVQIEDEKEEATRALETEFETMEELEARVRKLKEKREALRRGSVTAVAAATATTSATPATIPEESTTKADGKENVNGVAEDEEDDDDEEEDDEDDWVGFRFRA